MFVRPATLDDIPGIAQLLLQVHALHQVGRPDLFKYGMRKYTDEELAEIISAGDASPVFVAVKNDGTIVGHAFCQHVGHAGKHGWQKIDTLYIDDICVDEGSRGEKIGTMLYKYVVAYARDNAYYNVTLNVWSVNPGALAFYEAMGMHVYKIGMEQVL